MRYEYGENLKDLAIEYKVPEITIKKRKSKDTLKGDPWIKGFRSKIAYKDLIETNENRKAVIDKEITEKARKELLLLNEIVDEFYKSGDVIVIPQVEKAFSIRAERIEKQIELRRKIESIHDEETQVQIDLVKANIELKKIEAETKSLDLRLKKQTMAKYLKE